MYTLGDVPRKGATLFPDKVAMIFGDTRIRYRELDERVNRLANALLGLGCRKGDRITILAENTHKYMEIYFAAARAGLSATPLNFRLSDPELIHIINDCEASVFLVGDGYEKRALALKKDLNRIRTWIAIDNREAAYLYYEELIAAALAADPEVPVDENDMAILMYTGGTTGLPKGVMLSHRNLLTAAYGLIMCYSFSHRDIQCFMMPLFHIALWPVLCLLMVGGTIVILPRADVQEALRTIQTEKCNKVLLVPTLVGWMMSAPNLNDFDLSSLCAIQYAGSPMPLDLLKKCIRKFGNIFMQGYGLTEAAPILTSLNPEDHILEGPKAKRLSSVGKEGVVVTVRVVDENDMPVKPGQVGEIVGRGSNIMLGYWKNPELTATTLRGGWLHTGDMGMVDEDGYIYLVDRKSDMIVTGGENVYPKEVEEVLYQLDAVQECAVVSAPDIKWGERVQAVVVLKAGMTATEEELLTYCKARLAGYKCPKKIEFWDEIPKTAIGKLMRRDVKKQFWKEHDKLIG
jgi:acyl-CoA synthetase (AMP-forming)/AMP-acid ligase II